MRTTPIPVRRARTAAATVAAVVALAACGGGDDATVASGGAPEPGSTVSASPVPGIDAEHNDQDIAFITDMKPHHEGALEMAELAATRAENPKVKDLAERILAAQDPEIATMQQMATAWGVDLESAGTSPHGGMDMGGEMDMGEDMAEDMAALEALSGAAFDEEFLTRMTAHHNSAVEMAEQELAEGLNPQATSMAQDIVTSQTAEIAEMKTLLAEL